MGGKNEKSKIRGSVKTERRYRRSRILTRLSRPGLWSLRTRFLYTTGVLLLVGNLSLIIFLAITFDNNMQSFASRHLDLVRTAANSELNQARGFLMAEAATLAAQPGLVSALNAGDEGTLRTLAMDQGDRLRQGLDLTRTNIAFIGPDGQVLFATMPGNLVFNPSRGERFSGMLRSGGNLVAEAGVPVLEGEEVAGRVRIQAPLSSLLDFMDLPMEYGLALVVPDEEGGWRVLSHEGVRDASLEGRTLGQRELDGLFRHTLRRFVPLQDATGVTLGGIVMSYDITALEESKWQSIYLFSWIFVAGALLVWSLLFFNVSRVITFLDRLKRIIIASHSNNFAERFDSDHIYCLDVMNCHNEECPVYQDPSLVCYLETGSEAISPLWRNTCIFLNKYEHCENCPVHTMRRGDELSEMRNVVNTMMRHWSSFLSRVGRLLPYLLRSRSAGDIPSLDDISERIEQMAKLTFFGHDLQGVHDKEEVFQQIRFVFDDHFNLGEFLFLEVEEGGSSMVVASDQAPDRELCRKQVQLDCDLCRAYRMAEDVNSFYNPVLCPYFNLEEDREFRYCMPVVMAGKVGAVFSFVGFRREWERHRRQLPILRKYLDETAPVLSSLGLLRLSKEQALRDPLTRCHNRRFLDEYISKHEPFAKRENHTVGFLMADLDYFKQVNDTYGHEAGDAVLQQMVDLMNNLVRRSDLIIRYGGEEFLVLLLNVAKGAAEEVAEKIRLAVEVHPFELPGGQEIHKTLTIGVSEFPHDGASMYKAMKFADVALYEGKNAGRNRTVRFKPEMWTAEEY